MVDVELKNLLWKFCRFEKVQDDSTGGGRLRPFLHFDHCLLYHLDEVYIVLKFLFVFSQIHLGDIKVPFCPLRNAREVRRVLVEHLNHSGFFQDIVQTKSRLYLELWKTHVDFYQPFLLFKMALDISCF